MKPCNVKIILIETTSLISDQLWINFKIFPSTFNLLIELCLGEFSGRYDWLSVALIIFKVSSLSSNSDVFVELMEILRSLALLEVVLEGLISILCGELSHLFLID